MHFLPSVVLPSVGLFLGMLALLEVGRRLDQRRRLSHPGGGHASVAAANGAVFALLGLMVAFSFQGASERFERRRDMITAESIALGSAWAFLDLLTP